MAHDGLRPRSKSDAFGANGPSKGARLGEPAVREPVALPRLPLLPRSVNAALSPGPASAPATPRLAARLPDELLLEVLGYLDAEAYRALSLVNRGTLAVLRSPDLERAIWRNTVGGPMPLAPPTSRAGQAGEASGGGARTRHDDQAQQRTARASIRRELTLTRSLRDAGPMAFATPLPGGADASSYLFDADGGALFWLEKSRYTHLDLLDVARTQRRAEPSLHAPNAGPWQPLRYLAGPPARGAGPEGSLVFHQLLGATAALLCHPTGPEAYLATVQPTRTGLVAAAPLPLGAELTQRLKTYGSTTLRGRGFVVAPWKVGPLVGHSGARGWHLFEPATGELALALQPPGGTLPAPSPTTEVGWMFAADLSTALCFADMAQSATLLRLDPSGHLAPQILAGFQNVHHAGLDPEGRWAFVCRPHLFSGLEFVSLAPGVSAGFRVALDYAALQVRWSPRGDTLVTLSRRGHVLRSYGFDPARRALHLRTVSRPDARSEGRADAPEQLVVSASGRRAALIYADEDNPLVDCAYAVVHGLVP